jgi:hypothetical protein
MSQECKPQALMLEPSCLVVDFFKLQAATPNLRAAYISSGIRINVTKNGENEKK